MKKFAIVIIAVVMIASAAHARAQESAPTASHPAVFDSGKDLKWQPAPPSLKKGAEMAVLNGDPGKEGSPFTLRIKMPKDYKVAPHSHPSELGVTVLSGKLGYGMGDKLDTSKGRMISRDGFFTEPVGMHHYVWTTEPTIIQIHGTGPLIVNYVNPADDPSKAH